MITKLTVEMEIVSSKFEVDEKRFKAEEDSNFEETKKIFIKAFERLICDRTKITSFEVIK